MALCLAQSLIDCKGFDPKDQMLKYCKWYDEGYMSSTGECFDIGNTTLKALDNFIISGNPYSNVTDENITSINDAIFHMGVSSQYQVQQLVDSYNSILNYAANNLIDGNPPRHQDYSQIGVFSASENKGFLDLLNDVIYLVLKEKDKGTAAVNTR